MILISSQPWSGAAAGRRPRLLRPGHEQGHGPDGRAGGKPRGDYRPAMMRSRRFECSSSDRLPPSMVIQPL